MVKHDRYMIQMVQYGASISSKTSVTEQAGGRGVAAADCGAFD
jgi:hypothetical protein